MKRAGVSSLTHFNGVQVNPFIINASIFKTVEDESEVQRPLASVVVFGLGTSTVLTLFVIPVVYGWVEGRVARDIPLATGRNG